MELMSTNPYEGDDYDESWRAKEEPNCYTCTDYGWVKPWGYRRLLARVLPLCVIWWQWHGLLHRWGTLRGWWPCPGCNPCWIDTWWPTQVADRLRWWWRSPSRAFTDDEHPF